MFVRSIVSCHLLFQPLDLFIPSDWQFNLGSTSLLRLILQRRVSFLILPQHG